MGLGNLPLDFDCYWCL